VRSLLHDGPAGRILADRWELDPARVAALIEGSADDPAGRILCSLLSGPIDVDKMDYLARDSLHAGVPYGRHFDQERLLASLCLDATGTTLAITDKGRTAAELMVFARYVMFSEVYWHHAVRAATAMLQRSVWLVRASIDPVRLTRFDGPDVLSWKILDEKPSPRYRPGQWNHLRVRHEAEKTSCYVNDELVFETTDRGLVAGRVGLAKFRDTEAEFRGFAVGHELPRVTPPADVLARIESLTAALPAEGPPSADLVAQLLPDAAATRTALARRVADLEQQAARLETLAAEVHLQQTLAELAACAQGDEATIDLFRAALVIAKLDNPDLNVDASRRELEYCGTKGFRKSHFATGRRCWSVCNHSRVRHLG
jgi:hypothetical protein